ncbi:AAA family ATPase [Bradyrhizobium sp. 193]|uniref:AAA family ATPase n=1 Tax=Bradyrhizobium sp. 193 TaxID=2782661 RepID=UPI001FF7DA61|nr:AAA family ATPase [Bradyrhizobium sp. 193]MCK1483357.1 AAA family ATPase [Bradyrhizobium sp. 193]
MSARLKSLVVEDFRSIRGTQRLSLDASTVLIHGPNGTGKTSLLSAIEFGLTGAVASLGRFDPGYLEHLPHKKSPNGRCRVSVEVDGLPSSSAEVAADGKQVLGNGLLSGDLVRFFTERCYLPQAALGRLLEIYEHQDSRRSDSPLTRFVKELLGLEALDALIDGLHASGHVRRLRERAPNFWSARSGAAGLAAQVKTAEGAAAALGQTVADLEAQLRDELGRFAVPTDEIDPNALKPLIDREIGRIEDRLSALALRRRDLAAADAQLKAASQADGGQRDAAEAASTAAQSALSKWQGGPGADLQNLFAAIGKRLPGIAVRAADPAAVHASATAAVETEVQRLQGIALQTAEDDKALSDVEEAIRQGTSRLASIDSELERDHGANQELAQALTAISSHIQGEVCPVCSRDFSEISDIPLAAHVSEEVQKLIAAAGRVQALMRDRSSTSAAVLNAQRHQRDLTARRVSDDQRDRNKLDLAQFTEWKTALAALAEAASQGSRFQREASTAAGQLSILTTQQAGVRGLRAELVQHAQVIGVAVPTADEPLQAASARLMSEVQRQEETLRTALSQHRHILGRFAELRQSRGEHQEAVAKLADTAAIQATRSKQREESERRIAVAKDLVNRAQALRTEKVRQVFNDELNAVWSELFIRLAPEEEFVPEFALPLSGNGAVEAVLETRYRSGGRGGNPRAMLSAGNLNTAALTLFMALNLSVKPVLPWLIIDDPVQSMDDVHIAQFAALLRTLKREGRQVILAVHDRQLFDYLALELSPTFNGDRLITIELGRSADGMTTAPWTPRVFEPDKAIAA